LPIIAISGISSHLCPHIERIAHGVAQEIEDSHGYEECRTWHKYAPRGELEI
jgi:hypothetical protein